MGLRRRGTAPVRSGVAAPAALPTAQAAAVGHAFLLRLAAALAAQDPPVTIVLDDLGLVVTRDGGIPVTWHASP